MRSLPLMVATPFLLLLSHYMAVIPHELSHGFVAWMLGYKPSPFDIHWGGTSLGNLILLLHIDQAVDNKAIYALGHPYHVTMIASAGMLMNTFLLVVGLRLLYSTAVKSRPYLAYWTILFIAMNIGNIYDYVPVRTFATRGNMVDILDIEQSLGISPWWVWIVAAYPLAWIFWRFYTRYIPDAYVVMRLSSIECRAIVLITCTLVLFGYYALPGYFEKEAPICWFIFATSELAIPGVIYCCWPTRKWAMDAVAGEAE